jgi:hypothetical protein
MSSKERTSTRLLLPGDLASVAAFLEERCGNDGPRGYVPGKTFLRNALVDSYGVSELQSEAIVDTMEREGWLTYRISKAGEGDPASRWVVQNPRMTAR